MSDNITHQQALVLFERAHRHQMRGELADAIILYRRSLAVYPTPEAHTFLGWTYSMMHRYDEAIAECEAAINLDPSFGNPYNDIGSYLMALNKWEEAIPWLEKAVDAPRYDAPQFPHINLGRVYERLGRYRTALKHYDRALTLDPYYRPAHWAKYQLLGQVN
jgi:tetratricopeptide (TPR) repeat protein